MALYAFSPTLATIVNLMLFAVCLYLFNWARRQMIFYRTILSDLVLPRIFKDLGKPKHDSLTVFPRKDLGPFQEKAKCLLVANENGWTITQSRLFRPALTMKLVAEDYQPHIVGGVLSNTLNLSETGEKKLVFSRRYGKELPALANRMNIDFREAEANRTAFWKLAADL